LDGCLLELEEVWKLKAGNSIQAALLSRDGETLSVKEYVDLPPKGLTSNILVYEESESRLSELSGCKSSNYFLVHVPNGFDVIDVALVVFSGSLAIYGIQITRSAKPFAKHHTFDTCLPKSKERLKKFFRVICKHFNANSSSNFYVMRAPNCEGDAFKPPGGHSSDYYFSPASIIADMALQNQKSAFLVSHLLRF
jgi:hypothetical protein